MMNQTMTSSTLRSSLDLIEIKPGVKFSRAVLQDILPDTETALFFGKVYELDYAQLSYLLSQVLQSDLATELFKGDHSTELQDYIVGWTDEFGDFNEGIVDPATFDRGEVTFAPNVPHGEILPQVWESLRVEVADSIKAVVAKLDNVIGLMPGKQGKMMFSSMMKLNARRPTLGDYRAHIHHDRVKENLLILDVSGSMTEPTIRTIVDDVVALSYMANAHMAIVSNTTTWWEPGQYDTNAVLARAEFGGTNYETLHPLFNNRDWGTVITVADYDSSQGAKSSLAQQRCTIDEVVDISLVNRPTFLAECVGQFAASVKPLLVANSPYVLAQ